MADRNTSRRTPPTGIRTGDRPTGSDRTAGRQPTMQHPKPQGPVQIGKPIPGPNKGK